MADVKGLANMPSMRPPPGVMANFIDPSSQGKWVITCAAVCLSSSTLFVGARMYTKSVVTKSLDWSDYTFCIAWAGLVINCALGLEALNYGLGRHQWDVPVRDMDDFLKFVYATEMLLGVILFFIELSLLLLYSKIFVVNRRSTTFILIQLILWTNLLFYIAMTLACIFNCSPIKKFWDPNLPGKCTSSRAIILASAIFNVISNSVTVVLPVHAIWQLQMPTRRKIGVSAVFMAGLFACFGSIMRLRLTVKYGHSLDATYNTAGVMLWTEAEITTGLICGCLPIMPQFFHHSATKLSSLISRTRNRKRGRYFTHHHHPPSSSLPMHEPKSPFIYRPNSLDPASSETALHFELEREVKTLRM